MEPYYSSPTFLHYSHDTGKPRCRRVNTAAGGFSLWRRCAGVHQRGKHFSSSQRDASWPRRWHHWRDPERWLTALLGRGARRQRATAASESSQRLLALARPQGSFWSPQYPLIMRNINNFTVIIHFHWGQQRKKLFLLILSCLTLWVRDSLCMNILSCVFKEFCS